MSPTDAGDPLQIRATVDAYRATYPTEDQRLAPILGFLDRVPPRAYATRSTAEGHVTTSAFVLSPDRRALLLIHHRALNRYLQPGGHVESDASLIASALREVHEEVGLPPEALEPLSLNAAPIDIDPHRIPHNAKKAEPEHWHFDIRYLFALRPQWQNAIALCEQETAGWCWADLDSPRVRDMLPPHVIARLQSV